MESTGRKKLLLVSLIVVLVVLLVSSNSLASVSLKVDWRSGDSGALSQTIDYIFSGWAGISLQDVLRKTSLFSVTLENGDTKKARVYLTLDFEVDFDNPNYTDITGAGLRFEEIDLEPGEKRTFGANSVDIDVDRLVSDVGQALVDLQEEEDPELPDYLADLTTADVLTGHWPDVAEGISPPLDEDQRMALGILIAGEVIKTRQLPAGTYTVRVTLYRDTGYPDGPAESWVQVDQASFVSVIRTSADLRVVSPAEGQLVADGAPTFEWVVPEGLVGQSDLQFIVTVRPVGSSDEVNVGTLDLSQVSGSGAARLEYSDLIEPLDSGSYTWTLVTVDRTKSGALLTEGALFGQPIVTGFRVNSPPQVMISQQYVVEGSAGDSILEGDAVTFSGSAFDSEDGVIAPAGLVWSIDDDVVESGASLTYTFESPGLYTLQLSAVDAMGTEGTDTLSVAVTENSPPVITSFMPESDIEVTEGEVVTFYAQASDPDRPGQTGITYVWSVEGIDYGFSPEFSFVFGSSSGFGASDGPYVVTLTVYDDLGASVSRDVIVAVGESDVPGGPSGDVGGLIREIIDLTGGGTGPSLGQELFGFIPSFAGMAVIVDDDGDGGDGGAPGAGSPGVIYILSPRNGEVRYASETIAFVASAEVVWALDDQDNVVGSGRHFMRLDPGDHVVYVLRPLPSGDTELVAEISVPVESEPETLATVGMMQTPSVEDAVYVGTPSQSAGSTGLYWERPATPGTRLVLMQRVRVEGEACVDIVYDDGFIVNMPSMANPHIIDPLEASLLEGGV